MTDVIGATGPTGSTGATGPAGFTWSGVWNSTTTYTSGCVVTYGNQSWLSLTTNKGTPPPPVGQLSNLNWEIVAGGISWSGPWSSHVMYPIGTIVSYGNQAWISVAPSVGIAPPTWGQVNTPYWDLFAGNPGSAGIVGPTGATGSSGASVTGPQGGSGVTGSQGPQGMMGATGSQGVTGPQGPQGDAGATGSQGVTGSQGLQGDTGAIGATGSPGDTGSQGIAGVTGPVGATGVPGVIGPQGIGLIGPTGSSGIAGQAGQTGATGATGPTGATGAASTVPGPTGATGATGGGYALPMNGNLGDVLTLQGTDPIRANWQSPQAGSGGGGAAELPVATGNMGAVLWIPDGTNPAWSDFTIPDPNNSGYGTVLTNWGYGSGLSWNTPITPNNGYYPPYINSGSLSQPWSGYFNGVTQYTVSPALPSGLYLDPLQGYITGTPTITQASASYTITAANPLITQSTVVNIAVSDQTTPVFEYYDTTPTYVQTAYAGESIKYGPWSDGTYTYSISPDLPVGLSMEPTNGYIYGYTEVLVPSTMYTITATNAAATPTPTTINTYTTTITLSITPLTNAFYYQNATLDYALNNSIQVNSPQYGPAYTQGQQFPVWINQGGNQASVSDQTGQMSMLIKNPQSNSYSAVYQTQGNGNQVIGSFIGVPLGNMQYAPGVYLIDSLTGAAFEFGISNSTLEIKQWSSPTTAPVILSSIPISGYSPSPIFLSILDEGAEESYNYGVSPKSPNAGVNFLISMDMGQNWDTIYTILRNTISVNGPNSFGLGISCGTGANNTASIRANFIQYSVNLGPTS